LALEALRRKKQLVEICNVVCVKILQPLKTAILAIENHGKSTAFKVEFTVTA